MNLVELQERLKDLPLQALAAYANGMDETDVPPSMALMEINRRNRMRQQAQPMGAPSGTVKDQIEQQAGLAALQQARMAQAQQDMMQGAATQPMPAPEGIPQPQEQPEMAGIANAAAQPGGMEPDVLGLAGGGIVAFARGGSEDDGEDDDGEDDDGEDEGAVGAGYGGYDVGQFPAETAPVAPPAKLVSRELPPQAAQPSQDPYDIAVNRRVPTAPATAAAPQGPQSTAQQLAGLQALAAQQRMAVPQAPESPLALRDRLARENPAMYGVLAKPAGQEYLAGLEALMKQQATMDPKALEQVQAGRRMDFWNSLIAAGEATRGRGGIGSLFGGFGRSMIPAIQARQQQEADIANAPLERMKILNKAKFEVERLQQAQAAGDVKAEDAYKNKLYDTAVRAYASGNSSLAREIGAIAGIREKEIAAAGQAEAARIRAAAKGQGGEKTTDFRTKLDIKYKALLARGFPPGEATMDKAYDEVAETEGKAASTIRAETDRQDKADKWLREEVNFNREVRKLKGTPAYADKLKELEEESKRRYGVRGRLSEETPTRNPPPAPVKQAPIYARNPATKERIMSTDGGKTWKPAE